MSERTKSTAAERERAVLVGAERPRMLLPAKDAMAECQKSAQKMLDDFWASEKK